MSRLLLLLLALIPLHAFAQSTTLSRDGLDGTVAGDDVKALRGRKLDLGGDLSGQHVTARGGSQSRTISDKNGDALTTQDFLLPGQTTAQLLAGTINAQPALTAFLAAGGGKLDCGVYRLDAPLAPTSGSTPVLVGDDEGCVKLFVTFPTGDVFALNNPQYGRFENLIVAAAVQRMSGGVFNFHGGFKNTLRNVTISGPQSGDAVLFDGSNTAYVEHLQCSTPNPTGAFVIGLFWAGACVHRTGNALEIHVSHSISNNWHYGEQYTWTGGGSADNNDWIASGIAMYFDPSATLGQTVWGIGLSHIYGDTSLGDNWYFGGDGPISDIQADSAWASFSQTSAGMAFVNPNINGLQFANADVLANHASGIAMNAGTGVQFSTPQIAMNSQQGSNLWPGILVGATAGSLTIIGGICGHTGHVAQLNFPVVTLNLQSYCLIQSSGATAPQTVKIIGLTTTSNVGGAVGGANLGSILLQPSTGYYSNISLGNSGN